MKKKTSIGIIVLVVIFLAISMTQYTGFSVNENNKVIRIGYKANANYVPLFVALENRYFEEQGLKVETFRFDSTNTLMNAFAAGELDATPEGNVIVSYSLENNHPGLFKIYAGAFYTNDKHPENMIVRKDSGINKYSDLNGKKIGTNKGVFARIMLTKFLEKKNVNDFEMIELSKNLQLPALERGQIDALLSLEPYPTIGVEKGIGEYLEGGSVYAKTTGFSPFFSGAVISTKFMDENPEETEKFLTAMEKSFEFISDDLPTAKRILPNHIAIEPEIAEKITLPEYYFSNNLNNEKRILIQATADFLLDEEILKKRVDTGKLILKR
jgi:ABC-type nitrate/sulfonate/bicarbonate transport system substrate-binding protein